MKMRFVLPGVAFAAIVFSGSASATPADDRWAGWIGCWRADAAPVGEVLCVVPEGDGVRMVTISNGSIVSETRMIADAQSRPISEGGCEGTEKAQWSNDGYRVYTQGDMNCGFNVRRKVSGILAMVTPKAWVNVQSIGAGEHVMSRTVRYTATDLAGVPDEIAALATPNALARETVRWASTEPLDLDDVREAVRMVDHSAVEALVLARNEPFDMDAKTLVALDEEGVPGSVIDALVAVSHPEEFAVVAELEVAPSSSNYFGNDLGSNHVASLCSNWRNGGYDPWLDPYAASELCYGYSYLGMSRYGRSFGRYGYGWGYGYRPIIVVRDPDPTDDDSVTPSRRGTVSRSGYRSGSSSTGSARARNENRPSSSVSSSRSSSSSRATTSTSSSSSSSKGTSTGRTAKRRGGG